MATPIKNSQNGRFTKGQFAPRHFTFRLKPKYDEAFREICNDRDRIPAELIREIIQAWIDAQKKSPAAAGESVAASESV